MFEEAARLLRQMDDILGDDGPDLRTRLFAALDVSRKVWDTVRPFLPENPWPFVVEALGSDPLRQGDRVWDLIELQASGTPPGWADRWLRRHRLTNQGPDGERV